MARQSKEAFSQENAYLRLQAQYNQLDREVKEKEKAWSLREEGYITNEAVMRDFCERILAMNPKEMVLGAEYTWKKVPMRDLISKTQASFESYNSQRVALLRRLNDHSAEQRSNLESLKGQFDSLMQQNRELEARLLNPISTSVPTNTGDDDILDISYSTAEPAEEGTAVHDVKTTMSAEEAIVQGATEKKTQEAVAKSNYKIQQGVESGRIEAIIEDDSDYDADAAFQLSQMAMISETIEVANSNVKMLPSERKKRDKRRKAEAKHQAYMVDLAHYSEKFDDMRWFLFEVMGTHGISELKELVEKAQALWLEKASNNLPKSKPTRRNVMMFVDACHDSGLLSKEDISIPLAPRLSLYTFTEMGRRLYESHFGHNPEITDYDKIVAEHDNPVHGYGIVTLAKMLESKEIYKSVSTSRKQNSIKVDEGTYIPDIVADDGKYRTYYEYELGTHHQTDFNVKLNKMARCTSVLNLVVPTKDDIQTVMMPKVKAWIDSRGGYKSLKGKKVRITTPILLKDKDPKPDQNWHCVFRMSEADPIINDKS